MEVSTGGTGQARGEAEGMEAVVMAFSNLVTTKRG